MRNVEKRYLKIEPKEIKGFPERERLKENCRIVVDKETGKIVKIGNPREIREWIEGIKSKRSLGMHPPYKIEQLKIEDGALLPGLVETHSHPTLYSMLECIEPILLFGIKSEEAIKSQLKRRYQEEKNDLLGIGWDAVSVPGLGRKDLDEISDKHSIFVIDPSFHGGIANSKGLEKLRRLQEIREKEIGRKLKGEISQRGRITEEFVMMVFEIMEAQKSIEEISEARVKWIEKELQHGITTIHDMIAFTPLELNAILASQEKWRGKYPKIEFPVTRFFVRPEILRLLEAKATQISNIVNNVQEAIARKIVGIKLLADGSIGSYTAEMTRPYLDKKTRGIEVDTIDRVREAYDLARKWGISQIAMHAIGDKAIRRAIEYAKSWIGGGKGGEVFRIEHFEIAGKRDILKEASTTGIWVSSQPNFIADIVSYEGKLGKERTRLICPHKSIVEAGIPMMFGTDGMPQNMLFAIWCATHHPIKSERLSLEEALIASAAIAGEYERSQRGRLIEGAPADFIVIDPRTLTSLLEKEFSDREIEKILGSPSKIEELTNDLDEGIKAVIKSGNIVRSL